ncbi:hypothetical protein SMACR_05763 [Sordaria macrospora]|uniref:WGS project CABT00000000 data, contig 2.6 n=3 Tax=Sordaria macrospora TaxID=5147 RepID=F7VT63_SORMK|nr:uncharacterized protein SMAC_05763 [Sordaria macrospora k-hell]KAA8631017.1 hypothetical protein SMACR_05763 [Sordaria macrospora]KAH7626585.1 hypothetical protein B0T09DRAFT_386801 [Sordaria sp. MPI-SDFR-AT-0083]CCC08518.1 unnamed protein product [Sordaria macrospora k-hell]
MGSKVVPTIDFANISDPKHSEAFCNQLRRSGVAIIRNVIPKETAASWKQEASEYLSQNPGTRAVPTKDPQLYELYWSPAQIKARAHPNVIAAQKFAMGIWESKDPNAKVSTNFPITYADRVRIRTTATTTTTCGSGGDESRPSPSAHVDSGSVERWEPDGYGNAGTYKEIFDGHWEDYNPWKSSSRVQVTSDLYQGAGSCSIFRMFQGLLAMSPISSDAPDSDSDSDSLQVCPMPQLATAYFLLRPFFSPSPSSSPASSSYNLNSSSSSSFPVAGEGEGGEDPSSPWLFDHPHNSILHGALPSYAQDINPTLHPHLQLDRSLVTIPRLEPGDYVLWHPDLIHVVDGPWERRRRGRHQQQPQTQPQTDYQNQHHQHQHHPHQPSQPQQHQRNHSMTTRSSNNNPNLTLNPHKIKQTMSLYLPCCPLTQTNALYLSRQRKAFLLGKPGPDFGGGGQALFHQGHKNYGTYGYGYGGVGSTGNGLGLFSHLRSDSGGSYSGGSVCGSGTGDESSHMGRAGVQDVNDAGGDDGLRTMGLLPWDEEEARTEAEREVLAMANGILFPDLYDCGRI